MTRIGVLEHQFAGPAQFQPVNPQRSQPRNIVHYIAIESENRIEEKLIAAQGRRDIQPAGAGNHIGHWQEIRQDHGVGRRKKAAIAQKGKRVVVFQQQPPAQLFDPVGQPAQAIGAP